MDEPCSALDPIATARIEELIDELREKFYYCDSNPLNATGSTRITAHGLLPLRASS